MRNEQFYQKLVQALVGSGYRFSASEVGTDEVLHDTDKVNSTVRVAARIAPLVLRALTGSNPLLGGSSLHALFDQAGVQRQLDAISEFAELVCFKYVLDQPAIVSVVEADQLSKEKIIQRVAQFDSAIVEMQAYTGKMGGFGVGKFRVGATTLSVTGIILFVFFDPANAKNFCTNLQERCKTLHVMQKTWVLPWTIDVAANTVTSHSGLPFLMSKILSAKQLTREIFQT